MIEIQSIQQKLPGQEKSKEIKMEGQKILFLCAFR
jgi:hypothetical protein